MRIGINATCAGNRSGTGRYAAELIRALARIDTENRYFVLVQSGSPLIEELADRPQVRVEPLVGRGLGSRLLFERAALGRWIAERQLDVFHGPAFVLPSRCPAPSVVTIHDLVFRLFPETVPLRRRFYYGRAIPRSIRQAEILLVDSHSTAADLGRLFHVPDEKVRVAHLGVAPRFFEAPGAERIAALRRRLGLPDRFILTLGTLEPRKNLVGLLRAYARLAAVRPETPALVVAGRRGWGVGGIEREVARLGIEARVLWVGFVPDSGLPALYAGADLFVLVSLYEGFGLPLLEAMAGGTPVLGGDNSSMPEVVGDAGWLADAASPDAIAQALAGALSDPAALARAGERCRKRAREFTWDATARSALRAYEDAAARRGA